MWFATRRCAWLITAATLAAAGCTRAPEPDAYGNVEATEVVVGAENPGQLVWFKPNEGERLAAGAVVGEIDTSQLALERGQLAAERAASASRVNEVTQQIQVLEAQRGALRAQRDALTAQRDALTAQREIAGRAYARTRRLFDEKAATAQQLDQTERDYRVLGEQIEAQNHQIRAQGDQIKAQGDQIDVARATRETMRRQVASADARVAQLEDRIRNSRITNPVAGTVLVTYARTGEWVPLGQPLYKIANLESMEERAYITETQLTSVRLGQSAQVSVDVGKGERRVVRGTVTWIASQAEFTPTPIQTREERADLVYALKIRVPNEGGILKIGMPADVQFVTTTASR